MEKYYDVSSKIIRMPEAKVHIHPTGLGSCLFDSMKKYSENVAQIIPTTGEKIKYSDFGLKCVRTAIKMREMGIGPRDVVTVCSHNHENSAVPFVSTLLLGAITASMDPTLSCQEVKYLIDLVQPKLIFVSDSSEKLIVNALDGKCESVVVFGKSRGNEFADFLRPHPNEIDFEPYESNDLDETAIILFSSGTTGLPKGICLSHKFFLFHCLQNSFKIDAAYATLYWLSTTYLTLYSIIRGRSRFVLSHFNPKKLWEYLEKYQFNGVFLSPCDVIQLHKNRPKNYSVKLDSLVIGGSSLSKEILFDLKTAFPETEILFGYGQTELFVALYPEWNVEKVGSVGRPMDGRAYKIVDPATEQTLGANQPGELRIKTEWRMNGYYKTDSGLVYDSEGFVKTGDEAYYDEDFYFYIVDRIKEMFKYKSWHIIPAKLEAVLLEHPDVSLAAVVGIPHPEDDNHILGVVQLIEGSAVAEDDIRKFAEKKLDDRHKLRAGLRFVTQMPLTPSGKIKRRTLRDLFINGKI